MTQTPLRIAVGRMTMDLAQIHQHADPLDVLPELKQLAWCVEYETRKAVTAARNEGWSWELVGTALGISRQAAHQRFAPAEPLT
jgi:hypothetical protein